MRTETLMDATEAELRQREADALNRLMELEQRYREAQESFSRSFPGEDEAPELLPLAEVKLPYLDALEQKLESARKEYEAAKDRLQEYRTQRREPPS